MYNHYDNDVSKNIAGKRMLLHLLAVLILPIGLVMLFTTSLQPSGLTLVMYITINLSYLMRLLEVKCENACQLLTSLFKYRAF